MATAPLLQDIYSCTPRQARSVIVDCIEAGLVPYNKSSPGLGKSTIMRNVADYFNLEMIDHRLSTSSPEDLSGLPDFYDGPNGRQATFAPFDIFPLTNTPLPKGKDGWLIFLDEINSAAKAVQAASYKLVLDKMVGQKKLHPFVRLGMAGNLITDRALVNPLSTAMQSRVVHINMIYNYVEWLEDVAIPEQYDERIIAYIGYKESTNDTVLMNFRPDHQDDTFCCPRTWEFMNKLVKGKQFELTTDDAGAEVYTMNDKIRSYVGTITPGVAVDFVQFTKVFHEIVKIEDVLRDPINTPIPPTSQGMFAVTGHLSGKVTPENLDKVATYVNRMGLIYRILFFRTVKVAHLTLRHHPAYAAALIELSRYLHGN